MRGEFHPDWSLFDKDYPVEDGIVNALPPELQRKIPSEPSNRHFFDIHPEIMKGREGQKFLEDKQAMADMQMDFYDRMAMGFQNMDDVDEKGGGVFGWKIRRLALYDARQFVGKTILFIGAGNCRIARIFAQMGFYVVATDISRNMLAVGKERNDKLGVPMTYVAANAELQFPFKSESFDNVYSLCVMNHITDWHNYLWEKLRCLKRYGVFLERMPNALLWNFWKAQGMLYEGVEIKAQYCSPVSAKEFLEKDLHIYGDGAEIWTHDHQVNIIPKLFLRRPFNAIYLLHEQTYLAFKLLYRIRIMPEDLLGSGKHNNKGIYTMIKLVK